MHISFPPIWVWPMALLLIWGFNFCIWGTVGLIRLISTAWVNRKLLRLGRVPPHPKFVERQLIQARKVAVLIPAHNEELVIADTIGSLQSQFPPSNIFVVSDGSIDQTANIARTFGVHVLELSPSRGKAGALEEAIKRFHLRRKFRLLLFLDADTVIKSDYLEKALPFFLDPNVVALAGYASTRWDRGALTFSERFILSYRERVYVLSQMIIKFGQSWKYVNVTSIVPGFASLYRTKILNQIEMNPPGLVIEDFNMTFEIHHKGLGRIAHHPSIVGLTQDPVVFRDYLRQVKRWQLGLWQTVRRHGVWGSFFWLAMFFLLLEVFLSSLLMLLLPFIILVMLLPFLTHGAVLDASWFNAFYHFLYSSFNFKVLLVAIILPDYVLSLAVGIIQKQRHNIYYGLGFLFMRFFDSYAFVSALFKAFFVHSTGRWISPSRR